MSRRAWDLIGASIALAATVAWHLVEDRKLNIGVLVVAPFSEYSVFYHRLTVDRKGRLFLSYDYWSTHWFYRTDHWGDRRTLMMSPDGGTTWQLPQTADF